MSIEIEIRRTRELPTKTSLRTQLLNLNNLSVNNGCRVKASSVVDKTNNLKINHLSYFEVYISI